MLWRWRLRWLIVEVIHWTIFALGLFALIQLGVVLAIAWSLPRWATELPPRPLGW